MGEFRYGNGEIPDHRRDFGRLGERIIVCQPGGGQHGLF